MFNCYMKTCYITKVYNGLISVSVITKLLNLLKKFIANTNSNTVFKIRQKMMSQQIDLNIVKFNVFAYTIFYLPLYLNNAQYALS